MPVGRPTRVPEADPTAGNLSRIERKRGILPDKTGRITPTRGSDVQWRGGIDGYAASRGQIFLIVIASLVVLWEARLAVLPPPTVLPE
jgi:hypothetical protein